ncbi:hypothetical protein [Nocardia sp. R6R-6]|uniref:hypothetical protein n=1 Tax=Nocardia sp. R6R-6 TaxID=3459303 RepID=UPI00403D79BE
MRDEGIQEYTQVDTSAAAPASVRVLTDNELAAIRGGGGPIDGCDGKPHGGPWC